MQCAFKDGGGTKISEENVFMQNQILGYNNANHRISRSCKQGCQWIG